MESFSTMLTWRRHNSFKNVAKRMKEQKLVCNCQLAVSFLDFFFKNWNDFELESKCGFISTAVDGLIDLEYFFRTIGRILSIPVLIQIRVVDPCFNMNSAMHITCLKEVFGEDFILLGWTDLLRPYVGLGELFTQPRA